MQIKTILILSIGIVCGASLQAMEDRIEYTFKHEKIDPIEAAVEGGKIEKLKSLIEQSRDKKDSIKKAMWQAGRHGQLDVAQLLLGTYSEASSKELLALLLTAASFNDKLELVKLAVNSGADLDVQPSSIDDTPLIGAAGRGHTQIVRYLIEHGANVNARSIIAGTPLQDALKHNHLEAAHVLLTTLRSDEVKKFKTAVASIRFGTPITRDVRNIITLKLIQQFAQEHMNYARKLLEAVATSADYRIHENLRSRIAALRAPESWNALTKEVEANFRRALALPSAGAKSQGAQDAQLTKEQQKAANAFVKAFEGRLAAERAQEADNEDLYGE